MPRREGVDPDTGIRDEGDVLTGQRSFQEIVRGEAERAAARRADAYVPPHLREPVQQKDLGLDRPENLAERTQAR
jgi:hypothetical protein